ncbi:MAG: hypothetical protein EOP81_12625 [Variovorax sp.]|nr:MAG: hypothetical protein EOP81_12625 [Variovorax sp.]
MRRASVLLGAAALLAGCAAPSPPGDPVRDAAAAVTTLSPAQVVAQKAKGVLVRWAGGIARVEAQEGGRDCFVLRYGRLDAEGTVHWPQDYKDWQPFVACGKGRYDRELVEEFTVLTFEGRVVDWRSVSGRSAPVIEISSVFRHSDCVQTTETNVPPRCRPSFLLPR